MPRNQKIVRPAKGPSLAQQIYDAHAPKSETNQNRPEPIEPKVKPNLSSGKIKFKPPVGPKR